MSDDNLALYMLQFT